MNRPPNISTINTSTPQPASMNFTLDSPQRRAFVFACIIALGGCNPVGRRTTPEPAKPLSAEDEQMKRKFQGLQGGQLRVDSLFQVEGLNIFDEHGWLLFSAASMSPPRGNFIGGYRAEFGVPKFLRVEWRDRYVTAFDPPQPRPPGHVTGAFFGGTVLGDYTIPVASRIPDALLEEKRRNGGGFRLKIRIHPDGPLIGWDLERAPGSAPDGSKFHHAGGDFQEAHIYQGKVLRKGWYIHPRTAERIETDF